MNKTTTPTKKADQYNDPNHNYLNYWDHRKYENQAEVIAINKFLKGKHFKLAVDVGGGYGRLSIILEKFADKVYLAEPSQQQLDIAEDFLSGHTKIIKKIMQADQLKFDDNSVDLITLVRVMHHLPDPSQELAEIARILSSNGLAIIEVANYAHYLNRVKLFLNAKKVPKTPVDIRSEANKKKNEIPFVNHNPETVRWQLDNAGLEVVDCLSVSNFRNKYAKSLIPSKTLLYLEDKTQKSLAKNYFGPSIFFLVKKKKL